MGFVYDGTGCYPSNEDFQDYCRNNTIQGCNLCWLYPNGIPFTGKDSVNKGDFFEVENSDWN